MTDDQLTDAAPRPADVSSEDTLQDTSELLDSLAKTPANAAARLDLAEHLGDSSPDAVREARLAFAALRAGASADAPAVDRHQAQAMLSLTKALDAVGDTASADHHRDRLRAVHGPFVEATLEEARRALETGQTALARDAIERIFAQAPDRPEAHRMAATLARSETPLDRRVGHLAAVAGLDPDDGEARLALGRRLRALDRPGAAAAALRAALRLDPTTFEAWRELAAILRDDGQFAAALPLARHLVTLRDDDARAHLMLGVVLDELGDRQGAADALQRALTLDGTLHAARRRLARALESLGRWDAALEQWQDAALREPRRAATLMGLGDALARLGRHADAVTWYRRAAERAPSSRTIASRLAEALLRREHWAAAQESLSLARPLGDAHGLPLWDGDHRARVLLHHRTADGLDALLLGLGLAVQAGMDAVCVVPRAVAGVTRRALPEAPLLIREDTADTAQAAAAHGATAQVRFRDLPRILRGKRGACVLPAWLAKSVPPSRRWAVVTPATGIDAPPPGLWDALAEALGPETVVLSGDSAPDRLADALTTVASVITADGPAAHIAGAMGLHGILVLPPEAPWWWGDRADTTPWYPRLRLLRAARPGAWDSAMRHLDMQAAAPDTGHAGLPPRPDSADQALAEALDRIAGSLGPAPAPLACSPLEERVPPRAYRVEAPTGAVHLRLGRFPPSPRGGHGAELHNMRLASDAGVAPQVLHGDPMDGLLATAALDGAQLTADGLRQRAIAEAAAKVYRRLHHITGFQGRYKPLVQIDRLAGTLERNGNDLLRSHATVRRSMQEIGDILKRNGVPSASCHVIPRPDSFHALAESDTTSPGKPPRLLLPDWSASSLCDPHWEVATLCVHANMPADTRAAFYAAYLGDAEAPEACRLPLFEAIACWWRWLRTLETLDSTPEDAAALADEGLWWGRLHQYLDSERLSVALAAARTYRHPASA